MDRRAGFVHLGASIGPGLLPVLMKPALSLQGQGSGKATQTAAQVKDRGVLVGRSALPKEVEAHLSLEQ